VAESEPIVIPGVEAAERSERIVTTGSDLLRDRDRRRDPAVRQQRRAEAEAARREALRASARPVTVGSLRGHQSALTVRQAASALVERYCGELRVEDGHAIVVAPPFASGWSGRGLRAAVEVLVEAIPVIVAAAPKGGGVVAPEALPDQLVGPGGVLL
jgi:hypothetical protein